MRFNSKAVIALSVLIVSLCCLWCLVHCDETKAETIVTKIPKSFDFAEYVRRFKKNYGPLETLGKARLFFGRTINIFKHNVQFIHKKVDHFLDQNEYTDMTPEEAKKVVLARDGGFKWVEGAKQAPDMPAEEFYLQSKDGIKDGFSMSSPIGSSEDIPNKNPINSLDFFSEENQKENSNDNPRQLLHEIRQHHELAAGISKVIELNDLKEKHLDSDRQLRDARRVMKISKKLNRNIINQNYDPSLIPSQAFGSRANTDFSAAYASLLMSDFADNLDPYPSPSIPKAPVIPDLAPRQPSTMGSLLSLVRDMYDVFQHDDGGEEVVSQVEEEEARLIGGLQDDLHASQVAQSAGHPVVPAPVAGNSNEKQLLSQMHLEQMSFLKSGPVTYDIDWRRTGCISRAKSQQSCNACYVFATLDMMEFLYCQQTKNFAEFSAQYVIDCGHKASLNGCQGGKLSNVGIFVKKYGIQYNMMYPFTGNQQQCPFDAEADQANKSYMFKPTITRWKLHSDIGAWYEWLPRTPLIVGINMPADFLAYGGGIHHGQDCVPGMVHAMVLVGSGIQDGVTFWLLKNTFSYAWGEGGYFRLSKRAPLKCFNSAIVAKAKF